MSRKEKEKMTESASTLISGLTEQLEALNRDTSDMKDTIDIKDISNTSDTSDTLKKKKKWVAFPLRFTEAEYKWLSDKAWENRMETAPFLRKLIDEMMENGDEN